MGRVEGKVAVVTGAAMGMGRAHAILLAREGATVAVTDLDAAAAKGTVDAVTEAGGVARAWQHDVAEESSWVEVMSQVDQAFGRVDVLVNNAGILLQKPVHETTVEEWDRIFAVNARGPFLGTRHVLGLMRKAGGGSIVNISSIYGIIGAPSAAAYEATKGAVRLLTKATAVDYAPFGIRANSVHPGVIRTHMTEGILHGGEAERALVGPTVMARSAAPEEVSGAVLFLASDESSFMTGSEVVVDGGYTAV
ncbi:MAG TPA: glucose 1-dehydrogenase [Acidimicrobiales bacterium]|nr:glucose 1-dehydrogenase [Acidimicrobiales bacterium]